MRSLLLTVSILVFFASCGDADPVSPTPPSQGGADNSKSDAGHHGAIIALGTLKLGGETFSVARHGDCVPGKEGAFVVSRVGAGSVQNLFLWVEDAAGNQISAPTEGDRTDGDWHFHATPRSDAATPTKVMLRLRDGDRDERQGLDLHAGIAPKNDGVAAPLMGPDGGIVGWLELKLHDDKGDLELWLAKRSDKGMGQPLDLPMDAVINVTFHDKSDRVVELRVRNKDKNEDEDGQPNLRAGRTNYFIFPGDTGVDASWLMGTSFRSAVTVSLTADAAPLTSTSFVLLPHAHGPGGHQH